MAGRQPLLRYKEAEARLSRPPVSQALGALLAIHPFSNGKWEEHSETYGRLGDNLAPIYGKKSGSVTDRGKNYGGGWDWASRVPHDAPAEEYATLHQLGQYLSTDPNSRDDAIYDLIENIQGIRDARQFVGPPDPYPQLLERSESWARENPRPQQQKAQGGAVTMKHWTELLNG